MAERKVVVTNPSIQKETTVKRTASTLPLFEKENFMWMIIGAVIIGLGMLLMAGGKNDNPNEFDYNVVYSKTRITIAPILIIAGLLVEIYAIFKRPKAIQQ
jgi:uncharacterized membrane protein YidH (DUF202 family)